ncbi:Uncharacterised protein [Serratia quinivorans]|uniref:Uncharacterized protein n=1 Tax=Serratia quinivorans TaxID=137545 RepID=A0A379YCK1_9GAMM|nr:Uncharacterised protein [Serratia quinivorans]SUI42917.1 Uncharacterised protein [Serratia quinivorans]
MMTRCHYYDGRKLLEFFSNQNEIFDNYLNVKDS